MAKYSNHLAFALSLTGLTSASVARAGEFSYAGQPPPTLPWLAAQAVPSPEVPFGKRVGFGLRWQLTPLLYSFGLNRRLSPWRFFVVEPLTRQSGSIELYGSPEYLTLPDYDPHWLWRAGARSYLPLVQRGEYLSISVGSSLFRAGDKTAAAYELGAYAVYGFVGVQLTWAPGFDPAPWIATLSVRVF